MIKLEYDFKINKLEARVKDLLKSEQKKSNEIKALHKNTNNTEQKYFKELSLKFRISRKIHVIHEI